MSLSGMVVEGDGAAPVEMVPGVLRRTLGRGEEMLLVEFTLEAGSDVPAHSHPHAQVGYVVRGRMRLTVGDEAHDLQAGDSYYIPGDVAHAATVSEDSLVVDVFCPPREDYLEG